MEWKGSLLERALKNGPRAGADGPLLIPYVISV